MANWGIVDLEGLPYLGTGGVLDQIQGRLTDSATMFRDPPTNPPVGAIRLNRTTSRLEEWDGTNWTTKILSISGGGTGGVDSSQARQNLGIGTLGTQNGNAVAITGGSIIGLTALGLSGHVTFSVHAQYNIGTSSARVGRLYVGGGLVAPVGVNKWVPTP